MQRVVRAVKRQAETTARSEQRNDEPGSSSLPPSLKLTAFGRFSYGMSG